MLPTTTCDFVPPAKSRERGITAAIDFDLPKLMARMAKKRRRRKEKRLQEYETRLQELYLLKWHVQIVKFVQDRFKDPGLSEFNGLLDEYCLQFPHPSDPRFVPPQLHPPPLVTPNS